MISSPSSFLRHRVTLQQPSSSADGSGGVTRGWSDVADLWARIEPLESQSLTHEFVASEQLQARSTHRITLRYRAGVSAAMRIVYESRVFNILSVTNVDESDALLVILAEEGVAV